MNEYKKINETTGEIPVPGSVRTLDQLVTERAWLITKLQDVDDHIKAFKQLGIKSIEEVEEH